MICKKCNLDREIKKHNRVCEPCKALYAKQKRWEKQGKTFTQTFNPNSLIRDEFNNAMIHLSDRSILSNDIRESDINQLIEEGFWFILN